jgi:DNA-binding transcriptional ArsR family regulator
MVVEKRSPPSLRAFVHPARIRIMAELAGRDGLSANELHALLEDVPLASLYRHLDALRESEIIAVAESRAARGPAERVFRLRQGEIRGDVRHDPANAIRVFTAFCSMLLGQFTRYLRIAGRRGPKPVFRGWPVYADDAEFEQLNAAFIALAERAEATPSRLGRKRRFVYVITVPEV